MITLIEFANIEQEITDAINHTLDELREFNQNDYALFLADGEYKKDMDTQAAKRSPYVIDDRMGRYTDATRLRFMTEFLTQFYSFPKNQLATDDNEQRMYMELMVYSHAWEAGTFLKKLYRLAKYSNGEQYVWDVNMPLMGKHDFIRLKTRNVLVANNNPLGDIITKGFHSQLRNAFAHSDFSFDNINNNKRIWLLNYQNKAHEIPHLSFDEWSKKFVYTALLSYHLLILVQRHRNNLVKSTGTNEFQIKHPSKRNGFNFVWIKYDTNTDNFSFVR